MYHEAGLGSKRERQPNSTPNLECAALFRIQRPSHAWRRFRSVVQGLMNTLERCTLAKDKAMGSKASGNVGPRRTL